MRKLITFLGKYPKQTTYIYNGQTYQGQVFAEALRQFTDFDQMLVFTTDEARTTTWPVLEALHDTRIQSVSIPIGADEHELWQLFEHLTEVVAPGDTVIFDITHGLRSIPFLVFLAAAYLKEARNVTIEAILYGAFELGNEKEGQPAPVIDLSGFVSLLDWLTATNRFIETGDGYPLADLLRQAQIPHPKRELSADEERVWQARNTGLGQTAADIEEVSRSLLTGLAPHAAKKSSLLGQRILEAEAALLERLPPYRVLAAQVRESYAPLGYSEPFTDNLLEDLRVQLHIIDWYMTRQRIPQAITLMREWIVNAVGYRMGVTPENLLLYHETRKPLEFLLNEHPEQVAENIRTTFENLPGITNLIHFWNSLVEWRNLIDHAAHRPNWKHISSKRVQEMIENKHQELRVLAVQFIPELGEK